jgi:hypothetical protein
MMSSRKTLMIIRVVRDIIISCALFGLVISLHAAQGKQAKKVPTLLQVPPLVQSCTSSTVPPAMGMI